jgi:structural maintenance of chromosomes protein 6
MPASHTKDAIEQALKTSLALRMGKWVTFRQHIALRCKYQFQHHLWTRGYYGKVIFDHNVGTLNLTVSGRECVNLVNIE